ncbi:MAG: dephospho-CoA kinase [Verrucomicrobiota bacterium]|nr:dephospho-CoA kinase [Verrucomicrobiota bacterium]
MSTIYGLTGGIGMGKSTVARVWAKAGLPVVDSDELAREVVQPGQPALKEIRESFGDEFIGDDGRIDRARLAACIFSDDGLRKQLEIIIHPRVRERWRTFVSEWRLAGNSGVVVIPLLFEVGAEANFDTVLCVACTGGTQRERLRKRGLSEEQIQQRIASQLTITRKMVNADHVLWNEGGLDVLRSQLMQLGFIGGSRM